AISAAVRCGTSAANWAWNCSGRMLMLTPPSASGTGGASAAFSVEPGNRADNAAADSPASGADAVTKTSPLTLPALSFALVITEPAYEWPTRTTGPWIDATVAETSAASVFTPRSGLPTATTG